MVLWRLVCGNSTPSAARVQALHLGDERLQAAAAGDSITLVLDREVDVSRGDLLVGGEQAPTVAREFEADLCWLDRQPLNPTRWYWLKQGTRLTQARITAVTHTRDISELTTVQWTGALTVNDIGRVQIRTRDALALDDYSQERSTGAFILIDDASHQTAAAGMVRLPG